MNEVERSITSMSWLADPRAFGEVMVQKNVFCWNAEVQYRCPVEGLSDLVANCADIAGPLKISLGLSCCSLIVNL